MKTSSKFALAISAATLMAAPLSAPAHATADGPDYYRVVNVHGSTTLNLRARPGTYSRVLKKIPFNARGLGNAVEMQGRWSRVNYGGSTGWVHNDFIAEDYHNGATVYKVVGLNSWDTLNIRKKPRIGSRIISEVPGSADNVEDCGLCNGIWCPVRFNNVDGWVHKKYLAVVDFPRNNQYSNYDRQQEFRDRYANDYMGLNRSRGRTWLERWQNRKALRRAKRNNYWFNRGSRY